jgi:hypothetical protein
MSLTRLGLAAAAAALLGGCAAPGPLADPPGQRSEGPGAASVFSQRTFKLVKTSDPGLELALEGLLGASYDAAVRAHSGTDPIKVGFTYSLAPKGAVYPFSEIEVSCIMQDKYARRHGPGLCADFFAELERKIARAVADRR